MCRVNSAWPRRFFPLQHTSAWPRRFPPPTPSRIRVHVRSKLRMASSTLLLPAYECVCRVDSARPRRFPPLEHRRMSNYLRDLIYLCRSSTGYPTNVLVLNRIGTFRHLLRPAYLTSIVDGFTGQSGVPYASSSILAFTRSRIAPTSNFSISTRTANIPDPTPIHGHLPAVPNHLKLIPRHCSMLSFLYLTTYDRVGDRLFFPHIYTPSRK